MFCLTCWLSVNSAYWVVGFSLLILLAASVVSIVAGIQASDNLLVVLMSEYMKLDFGKLLLVFGIVTGVVLLVALVPGVLLLTRQKKMWMHVVYACLIFLPFIMQVGLGMAMFESVRLSKGAFEGYCETGEWSSKRLGALMQDVARTMAEVEETALCVKGCACVEVKSFLWAAGQQNELSRKDFTGSQNDAAECL